MSYAAAIEHVHPAPFASNGRFGMMVFLASEVMLFSGLIGGYIVLRLGSTGWPSDPSLPHLPIGLTTINTIILLSSSFVFHWAHLGIIKGNRNQLTLGVLLTVLMGATFLSIQAYEWMHLYHEGLWFNKGGVYGSCFFTLTGFHGAHVTGGVVTLLIVGIRSAMGHFSATRHVFVECAGMYWHFVDIVWVVLYTILYCI
jgi:cytochrome c oxidase subunit III